MHAEACRLVKEYFKDVPNATPVDVRLLKSVVDPNESLGDQQCHSDFASEDCQKKCYSCLVALEDRTELLFCLGDHRLRVHIPRFGMIRWSGSVIHAGARYTGRCARLFFKVIPRGHVIKNATEFRTCECDHGRGGLIKHNYICS